MEDVKNKTSEALYDYYKKEQNLSKLISVSRSMLSSSSSTPQIRGEICETVLSIMLEEYINRYNLNDKWIVSKGLILKDRLNPTSSYSTELDLILFTAETIYCFECKSYRGKKILRDKGKLYVEYNGKEKLQIDIYEQHKKHFYALIKYLKDYQISGVEGGKPVKIIIFNFSEGELLDKRDERFKRLFPVVDESQVYKIFKYHFDAPRFWDIERMKGKIHELEEKSKGLYDEHICYVSSIHSNSEDST